VSFVVNNPVGANCYSPTEICS